MSIKNTVEQFGKISKGFHWLMALMVMALLAVGLVMDDLSGVTKLRVYNLHKSFGIMVLALVLCRIGWHVYSRRPKPVAGLKKYEIFAAHAVHYFLYVAMIGMPLTGWLFSSAFERPVSVFGLFTLPDLIEPNQELGKQLKEVHEILGYTLIGAIAAHIAAAFKHHFINKDATLKRMLP